MKIRTKLALLLTCVFALASCDKEDDIQEIKEISGVVGGIYPSRHKVK